MSKISILKKLVYSQILLGFILEIWAYKKLRPLLQKSKTLLDAYKKYPEFARNDYHKAIRASSGPLYLFIVAPFVLLKFSIGWGALAVAAIIVKFMMLFNKEGEPLDKDKFTYKFLELVGMTTARIALASLGISKMNEEKVAVDYSHYLGPGWKPTYNNAGTVICNHSVFIDPLVHWYR